MIIILFLCLNRSLRVALHSITAFTECESTTTQTTIAAAATQTTTENDRTTLSQTTTTIKQTPSTTETTTKTARIQTTMETDLTSKESLTTTSTNNHSTATLPFQMPSSTKAATVSAPIPDAGGTKTRQSVYSWGYNILVSDALMVCISLIRAQLHNSYSNNSLVWAILLSLIIAT